MELQPRPERDHALRSLEAIHDVTAAVANGGSLEQVLELIVERASTLVNAEGLAVLLREGDELVVRASAGSAPELHAACFALDSSTYGRVLRGQRPERVVDAGVRLGIAPREPGVPEVRSALLVPLCQGGENLGVLVSVDPREPGRQLADRDEQLLCTFAASAAAAAALAPGALTDRPRCAAALADDERRRWARELHDDALHALDGLQTLLHETLRAADLRQAQGGIGEALAQLEQETENLRSIAAEMRPAALDESGLQQAVAALLDRYEQHHGLRIERDLPIADAAGDREHLHPDLQTAALQLVEEYLANIIRHANAKRVRISIRRSGETLFIEAQDDGDGFDTATVDLGLGLVGTRERIGLVGGELHIASDETGTLLAAYLPTARDRPAGSARESASRTAPARTSPLLA